MDVLRRPLALLAALILALALCAPAWAQDDTEATADEPAAVEAQGSADESDGSDEEGDVEASGESSPSSEYSGPSFDRANNGRDDVNCRDFDFREDAEEFFEAGGREDEDELDEDPGDDDNMPCETLPSRDDAGGGDDSGSDEGSFPEGGVDSGLGGTAPKPSPFPFLPVGASLLFVAGLGWRRVARGLS